MNNNNIPAGRKSRIINRNDKLKKSRIGLVIIFIIAFFNAITSDLTVFMLSIPSFDKLHVYDGIIGKTPKGRYNSYMTLVSDGKKILFTCRMHEKTSQKCIQKEKRQLFEGKKGRIYVYRTTVNGILYENRLLQLEVNNKVILSYQEQKSKYYQYKKNHFYIVTYLSVFIFLVALSIHWSRFRRL